MKQRPPYPCNAQHLERHDIIRYVYYTWLLVDAYESLEYGMQDCVACMMPFHPDEQVIDDTLSIDLYHTACAPWYIRLRANVGYWLGIY